MTTQALLIRISSILASPDHSAFRDLADHTSSTQLTTILGMLSVDTHLHLQRYLKDESRAQVFSQSSPARRHELFAVMTAAERSTLVQAMSPQQRADIAWAAHMHWGQRTAFMPMLAATLQTLPVSEYAALAVRVPPAIVADLHAHLTPAFQSQAARSLPAQRYALIESAMATRARDVAQQDNHAGTSSAGSNRASEAGQVSSAATHDSGTASVADIMFTAYASIHHAGTVQDALDLLRGLSRPDDAAYGFVVCDDDGRLFGMLSLQDLLHAQPQSPISDIVDVDVVYARSSWPTDTTLRIFNEYGAQAAPVLDADDRVVGILPASAAIEVIEDEVTEDFHKGGGIASLKDISIKTASPFFMYRKRVFWLVVLVFGNLFSGAGLEHFSEMLEAYIALVFFLPLLVDSGGNAGAQAATLMVRALATGDVVARDWVNMILREFRVAGLLGLTMAIAVCSIAYWRGGPDIAVVVALSMIGIVILGSIIGMSLPFALSKLKLDPASASAPLVTSIVDAVGVIIYLSIATQILGAPAAL